MVNKQIVAALGPKGTFSEEIANETWHGSAEIKLMDTLLDVYSKVEKGDVNYGIVPIQDSVEGDVLNSIDILQNSRVQIVGETRLKVEHYLLGKKDLESLKEVGSHPQALRHTAKYMSTYLPHLKLIETRSTAEAAERASKDNEFGAIGSERLAKLYGLKILKSEIHDYGSNDTRFLVIGKHFESPKEGPAKTMVAVYPKDDRPGVLNLITQKFTDSDVNMTKIMSRPSGGSLGLYVFIIEFEGNMESSKIKKMLKEIKELDVIQSLVSFGSYSSQKEEKPKITKKLKKVDPIQLLESTFEFWTNEKDKKYNEIPI